MPFLNPEMEGARHRVTILLVPSDTGIIRLLHAEHYSPFHVTCLTRYFVRGDMICFLGQGQGGGVQADGKPLIAIFGRWIVASVFASEVL
jgi:hypothetical protein